MKISEKELNMLCNTIRREIKEENDYPESSLYMHRVDATLDVLQRFILKLQEKKAGE